jgi:hypothetical protein
MDDNLGKADACSASLVRAYQQLGERCTCRVIGQQVGNEVMSVFLNQCADALFNGPTQLEKAP